MAEIKFCPECRVPTEITKNYIWLNSGVMVQSTNLSRRIGFLESENLDPLYSGIGKIIGVPIDHLVMDIARRGTSDYFGNLIPPEVRGMIRNRMMGVDFIADFMVTTGLLNGFGKSIYMETRNEGDSDDYMVQHISEPFSLPLLAGMNAGGAEVLNDQPLTATYRELSPGVYEIKTTVSEHLDELEGRMQLKEYHHRDGDIELEKCDTCGGPAALSGFKWHLDRGVIVNSHTGRRMAIIGPEMQDPIFEELEMELGETVPRAVVEAQRRFIKSGLYSIEEISDEGDFRTQLALRGLGNLQKIRMGPPGLYMRIDNAANYLMAVGMVQGLFEMAFNLESSVDWAISHNGDLEVEVNPKS
jgi:hypothetical protein